MVTQPPGIVPRLGLLAADEATQLLAGLVPLRALAVAQPDHGQPRPPLPVPNVFQAIEHQVVTLLVARVPLLRSCTGRDRSPGSSPLRHAPGWPGCRRAGVPGCL